MADALLYESSNSKVYYLHESEWGEPVVVKVLNQEYPSARSIQHFYNEYEVIKDLDIPGVRKVYQMGKHQNRHSLVCAYVEGQTARSLARKQPFTVEAFLKTAVRVAQILGEVHRHKVIHKDVSGMNLILDPAGGGVHLIDFGISSTFDLKQQHLGNPERLEGNLSYISPEQTGRMNRIVDYRTDLYSLGVTFYEMLTGRLPFESSDAMEMVHAHIAQPPRLVHEVRPDVPPMVSALIDRLLAKNAEDRYQSAFGLKHDLERCLAQLQQAGTIAAFPLGEKDFSGTYQHPQQLYGRAGELQRLLDAFDRVAEGGLETMLVSGYSGTGKSALVHEIHKPITQRRGYFIEGKFDQFQRVVPYYALIQAFKEFVALLLTENEARLAHFSARIQEAVGAEGKVLTDVLPQLAHVIGQQPEVAEVGGNEAQNRFNYVFRKFVKAISTADHPIVLFIDDLQWADAASLNLLRALMTDPENQYLLCVCAYRDNEVDPSHPFIVTVGQMEEAAAVITRIEIGNLAEADVHALVADALSATAAETASLTRLVYEKTQGNAFFVTQFLRSLYEENLLYFSFEDARWHWAVAQIRDKNITDNVVELMAGKIQKLPDATQQALRLAACIGNSFDLDTLAVIHEKPVDVARADLQAALSEGLVMPFETQFKFAHDRIQQAVYSLIPAEDRNAVHYRTGTLLLTNIPAEQQEEALFDIVNQLNWGLDIVTDPAERDRLAALNLKAGRKARLASAFKPAYDYLETGISLLRRDHWTSQYRLSLDLYEEAAETAYYNGTFDLMGERLDAVFAHVHDLSDKIGPYTIRINAFKAENKLHDAIDTGLEVLAELGETFPKKPVAPLVLADLARTKLKLRGKDNEVLASLSDMQDPYKRAALRILNDIASPVYWARPQILPFVIFRMVQLSLRYGTTAVSAFGFAAYGLLMCGVLGDMKEGYRFGQLGLLLLDRYNAKEWVSQATTPIYALINHWSEHVHLSLAPFLQSYQIGFETGAVEFACINVNIYCIHCYLGGKPLARTEEEMQAYSQRMLEYKQETNYNYNEVYRQAALNLLGRSDDPLVLRGEAYDEEAMMAQNLERKDRAGTFLIHFNRMMLNYLFGHYEQAREHADAGRPLLDAVLAKFDVPNHWFYEGLIYLALARETGDRALAKRARKNIRQMRKWAKHAPENHRHKLRLLEAEDAWLRGEHDAAHRAYDEAIALAAEHQFMHEEALAYERAGLYYRAQQAETLAGHYLNRAYQAYLEWGAKAKLKDLAQRYPRLVSPRRRGELHTTISTGDTSTADASVLDLTTLMKASTAISGEIVLVNLLTTLMQIVVENAGAQRGVLLLDQGGQWLIQAESDVDSEQVVVMQGQQAEGSGVLPASVIQYVARTGESLVLNDAGSDERFRHDAYIAQEQPQSVLCLPILNQGKLTGLLYLEHRLTRGAFIPQRIELLQLLSGQIAIAIDNARLYEHLEEEVRERTAEVVQQKESLEQTLERLKATQAQLVQSEKMASLGQLTAGVAHEIKNPLNFINNFAKLNEERVHELRTALETRPDLRVADVLDVFDDLEQYAEVINQQGRRADGIVRAMMQHASGSAGQRERADVEALVEEYVTLAYHGMGTQMGDLKITIARDYDEAVGHVSLVPQEIGRVLLNLLNNAFYAVRERSAAGENGYVPTVTVQTRRAAGQVEIRVTDNGPGIPAALRARIFEPFFTTKPTGSGTGLGLSLAYDIVTQGHGGRLAVESVAGGGTAFVVSLPAADPNR